MSLVSLAEYASVSLFEWNGKWRVSRSFDEVSFPGWRSTIFGYRRIVFGARNSSLENVYIYIYGKYGILTLDRFHVGGIELIFRVYAADNLLLGKMDFPLPF